MSVERSLPRERGRGFAPRPCQRVQNVALNVDMRVLAGVALVALLASSSCRLAPRPTVPIDTGVNFAAHREHARIVLDRPPVLSRIAQTSVDVRGTYRAVVRNAQGGEVGWLRVKISPYQESPRIYDGVLPSDVAPGTAAAIAVALCSEIDWIENHTLDVNRGTGTSGPLQQSVPMGR